MSIAVLPEFDHDPPASHLVSDGAGRAGAGERIEHQVTWIGGDVQYAAKESFGLRCSEQVSAKEFPHLFLGFVVMTNVPVLPPCGRGYSLSYFIQESLQARHVVAIRTEPDALVSD
jgi:hypothetical protein